MAEVLAAISTLGGYSFCFSAYLKAKVLLVVVSGNSFIAYNSKNCNHLRLGFLLAKSGRTFFNAVRQRWYVEVSFVFFGEEKETVSSCSAVYVLDNLYSCVL